MSEAIEKKELSADEVAAQMVETVAAKWAHIVTASPQIRYAFSVVAGEINHEQQGNARRVINTIEAENLDTVKSNGSTLAFTRAVQMVRESGRAVEEIEGKLGNKTVIVHAEPPKIREPQ